MGEFGLLRVIQKEASSMTEKNKAMTLVFLEESLDISYNHAGAHGCRVAFFPHGRRTLPPDEADAKEKLKLALLLDSDLGGNSKHWSIAQARWFIVGLHEL